MYSIALGQTRQVSAASTRVWSGGAEPPAVSDELPSAEWAAVAFPDLAPQSGEHAQILVWCGGTVHIVTNANSDCYFPVINSGATVIAFLSSADNLGFRNPSHNVQVYAATALNCAEGWAVTRLASHDGNGAGADADCSWPSIDESGDVILFVTSASDLGAEHGIEQVFVERGGTVSLVSRSLGGGDQADRDCSNPAVSPDGSYVAFESQARNLVPRLDQSGVAFPFAALGCEWARPTTTMEVFSALDNGRLVRTAVTGFNAVPSWAGNCVAFSSVDSGICSGDGNGAGNVFLKCCKYSPLPPSGGLRRERRCPTWNLNFPPRPLRPVPARGAHRLEPTALMAPKTAASQPRPRQRSA